VDVSCSRCKLHDVQEYNPNPDEVFLKFLVRYDNDELSTNIPTSVTNPSFVESNQQQQEQQQQEQQTRKSDPKPIITDTVITDTVITDTVNARLPKDGHDVDGRSEDSPATGPPSKKTSQLGPDPSQTTQSFPPQPAETKNTSQSGHDPHGPEHDRTGQQEGLVVRTESEITKMIGSENPDRITRSVLFSGSDYLADYKVLREDGAAYGRRTADAGLDERISAALKGAGITNMYRFQDESIDRIRSGESVVIEAPTASGKTEAFLVPIVQNIISKTEHAGSPHIHAILVYPTKALARDQLPKIVGMADAAGVTVGIFDGDTDTAARRAITGRPPHILVTNFDTLHYHMMFRTGLGRMLHTVRVIVVDEAHTYSGIFGSNVHYIIKRLKRIADADKIQFVAASATLDDPRKFCSELFGIDKIAVVHGTGGKKHVEFAMLAPIGRKPITLVVDLVKKFTSSGHQTMAFSNSHRNSELLALYSRRAGISMEVHRAGLMPRQRAAVEERFKSGRLKAVSCTPTLELGIDMGGVDCVVSSTVPVNRLMQRMGRAARKGQRGYAFLVLGDDPISQYYGNHPDDYFEDVERLYIDPQNPYVEECQILAMARDRPISPDEAAEHASTIERHISEGLLLRIEDGTIVSDVRRTDEVLKGYNIRGMGESVDILHRGRKVGDRVCPMALDELYSGAVYFLSGRPYAVSGFDYPERMHATLESLPQNYPYHTRPLTTEHPSISEILERRMVRGVETAFCRLRIQKTVTGYFKIGLGADGQKNEKNNDGGLEMLDTPLVYTYTTKGIVFCAPHPRIQIAQAAARSDGDQVFQNDDGNSSSSNSSNYNNTYYNIADSSGLPQKNDPSYVATSGFHATEHVVIEGSNMIIGGASHDLGGVSMGDSGMIFVHDGKIGGSGASRALYDRLERVFERGMHIVGECPCTTESGCPRCTLSYRCGINNMYLHKAAALEIFERINCGESTGLLDVSHDCRPLV